MTFKLRRLPQALMLALILLFAGVQPAAAQSVLRDSETELFFKDISRPLIQAAGLAPSNVKIVMNINKLTKQLATSTTLSEIE